ncbi:MAG: dTMP kinase [Treponema sp.]|nr:dTMP kinase [Treponema sp.]
MEINGIKTIPNFIVFEGGDGSGTTTQLSMLSNRIKNHNQQKKIKFFSTFEPTEGHIGKIIRQALKKEISIDSKTLAMLFAADRNEHLYGLEGIICRVNKGELVICDRYVFSSLVYQGIECGDELPQILNSGFGIPELTIFLDIDPNIAIERMKERSSLEIYEYLDFQEKVREKYRNLIKIYQNQKAGILTIDASKNVEKIADQIWSVVSQMPILKV